MDKIEKNKQIIKPRVPSFLLKDENTNSTGNNYWQRIKKLIRNVQTNKYILVVINEFLSKFKIHITKQIHVHSSEIHNSYGITKSEYFCIIELIDSIAIRLNNLRTILKKKNIYFFDIIWCQTNISNLTELYIQTLYLCEKYGGFNLLYIINTYLFVYSALQEIFIIWDNEYNHIIEPPNNNSSVSGFIKPPKKPTNTNIQSLINNKLFNSNINSSSEDTSEDEEQKDIYTNTPIYNNSAIKYNTEPSSTQYLLNNGSFQKLLSDINNFYSIRKCCYQMNSSDILHKLINQQSAEYANMLNIISTPIQMSAIYIQDTQPVNTAAIQSCSYDLFNSLSIFQSVNIIHNKLLFNTNNIVSEIYKDLAIHNIRNKNSHNFDNHLQHADIWVSDITNPLIYTTIPNFDKLRDTLAHIFIKIKRPSGYLVFIITTILINENTIILNNYNFLDKQAKHITSIVNDLTDISYVFRENIIKLLSIKQLLTSSATQITEWCCEKWSLYNTIIKMPALELMNYFLAQSLSRKAEIITVLLLHSYHADSTFRAYILWDLLINENSQIDEKEIFIRLHTSIQSKLRNILDIHIKDINKGDISAYESNGNEYVGSGLNIKMNELSYEKRIQLLKTDDTTRNKAAEKLREINNKTTENSSKPQQYLDGLLSIPFGTFAKEWIISNSESMLEKSKVIIINFICLCHDYRDIYSWARPSLEWAATNFALPKLIEFIEIGCGLSSQQASPSSRMNNIAKKANPQELYNINNYQLLENETITKINVENNSLLENYLEQKLGINKCGISYVSKLNTYIDQEIILNRVLVAEKSLEATIIIEALNTLDISQLHDIQYELKQDNIIVYINDTSHQYDSTISATDNIFSISGKTYKSTNKLNTGLGHYIKSQYIIDNPSSRKIIVEYLINEGYFYDIGYPNDLIRFKSQINNLQASHTSHKQDKRKFITNSRLRLDTSIYGQSDAKEQIIRIIAQWINGNQEGYCLGFEGSPGLGKTSLAKYGISQALVDSNGNSRPFGFIALGGSANGSILEGHSYTYVGSTWGRIVDILIQSQCMNPIIFIDELDKISNTESGRELIGILTHLTDRTQNNEFMDKYFAGIKLDLSKVLFIFSYNDYSLLDPILADRIHRVRFENYTISDKVAISRDYLIPRISAEINMSLPITLDTTTIEYIINSYTYEAGVRKLKEKYYDIFRELNVRDICGGLDAYELSPSDNSLALTPAIIDSILATQHKIEIDRPLATSRIGVVYGLYATGLGIGGLTIIQVSRKLADHGGILLCTGKQGDVMMESMKVALTLACGLVPNSVLEKWGLMPTTDSLFKPTNSNDTFNELNKTGEPSTNNSRDTKAKWSFHIHVPDGATSKDGPSAGCAITLGLVSLLMDRPVRNDVSMTGEIDMLGHILPIGGLDAKITGSRVAGIREILVPRRNHQDLARIQARTPEICAGLTIHLVDTIQEVLAHGLVGGWDISNK